MGVLQKWGNSLGVRVPKGFADQLGLSEGAEIDVAIQDGAIVIRPARKTYVLADLLAGCRPEQRPEPVDWGPDVGREFL
jgi:antitoxin MazE